MEYPDGFKELVTLVKKTPVPVLQGEAIWEKFCRVVFIGKDRSDADITFLCTMLKKYITYDFVLKTDGEEWREQLQQFLDERLERIEDEDVKTMLTEMKKGIFYLSATLKGGARFFAKKKIIDTLDELLSTDEKADQFIEELVNDQDVTGIRYAKAIIWLHSTGRARHVAPPTRQLKSFLNSDIGPYYQFYEDDDYFMKRAKEMVGDFKGTDLFDIYRAIFIYRTLKSALPRGSKLTPKKLIEFLKKQKKTVNEVVAALTDSEKKESLYVALYKFMGYAVDRILTSEDE